MKMKLYFIIFMIYLTGIYDAFGNDENKQTDIDAYENRLKRKYGCEPVDEWTLIKDGNKGGFIQNVCLPKPYPIDQPPNAEVLTKASIIIGEAKIVEVDERKKSITMLINMMPTWEDPRIRLNWSNQFYYVDLPTVTKTNKDIWYPLSSVFITNMKDLTFPFDPIVASDVKVFPGFVANTILQDNLFTPNVTIVTSMLKWTIRMFCDFEFSKYPFDLQTCKLRFITGKLNITNHNIPIGFEKWFPTKQKEFDGFDVKQEILSMPIDKNYFYPYGGTTFDIDFTLTRQIGSYLYQYYIPCLAIVITSFFSFIIPLTAIPGRCAILVTQFLTITNIFIHEMSISPSGSKLNVLSGYILVSMFFVFSAMIEFALVLLFKRRTDWKNVSVKSNEKEQASKIFISGKKYFRNDRIQCIFPTSEEMKSNANDYTDTGIGNKENSTLLNLQSKQAAKIDMAAFILFSALYALFNFIYFSYLFGKF